MANRDYVIVGPGGRELTITGPDNASPQQLRAAAERAFAQPAQAASPEDPSLLSKVGRQVGNLGAGLVRGAGSIGATIMAPVDMAKDAMDGKGLSLESNRQRRSDMDAALQSLGADTNSLAYGAGKLGGEIAGTAGVGGVAANALGRFAPGAVNMANALRTGGMTGGGVGTRAVGGSVTGGLSAGLVDPESAGAGALVGGALPGAIKAAGMAGNVLGSTARKAGRAVVGEVAPEVRALADRAKQLGIDIPADRLVNSKPMDAVASGLNYAPFSGRAATEKRMEDQLNQALTRTFGQDSANVTGALRRASDDLGAKFEQTLSRNGVSFDHQLLQDMTAVFNKAEKELGSDALKPIASQVDELVAKGESGVIDGQAAYNIKRTLDRIGRRNGPEAFHALELKGVLMEALDRSLGPAQAQAFAKTRQQYGNMLALEKIAKNGAEGDISVARLANLKNINNPQLQELADIAAQFVKAREGQHGAMQRAVVGLGAATTGGLPGLAAGAAVGRATNAALNSNALRNAVMGQTGGSSPNALSRLLTNPDLVQLGYRAAPVLAAGQ